MDVLTADLAVTARWLADLVPWLVAPLVLLLLWEVAVLLATVITTLTER